MVVGKRVVFYYGGKYSEDIIIKVIENYHKNKHTIEIDEESERCTIKVYDITEEKKKGI